MRRLEPQAKASTVFRAAGSRCPSNAVTAVSYSFASSSSTSESSSCSRFLCSSSHSLRSALVGLPYQCLHRPAQGGGPHIPPRAPHAPVLREPSSVEILHPSPWRTQVRFILAALIPRTMIANLDVGVKNALCGKLVFSHRFTSLILSGDILRIIGINETRPRRALQIV